MCPRSTQPPGQMQAILAASDPQADLALEQAQPFCPQTRCYFCLVSETASLTPSSNRWYPRTRTVRPLSSHLQLYI
jgi:hypothetical protein